MSAILKYFGEQSPDAHQGQLNWPGMFGMPVRGNAGLLKTNELEERFFEARDFHHREFDLDDAGEAAEYNAVMDRIVNGWYTRLFVDRYRDEDTKRRKVYLEWVQTYGHIDERPRLAPVVPKSQHTTIKLVG